MTQLRESKKHAIVTKIKKLVHKYHINVAAIDYAEWARTVNRQAAEFTNGNDEEFEVGVRQVLAELRTSHTAFFHNIPDRLLPQHTINATLRRVQVSGVDYWMFLDVFEGGAADCAGIKPGQLLVAIDGDLVSAGDIPKFSVGRRYRFTIGRPAVDCSDDVAVEIPFVKGSKAQPPLVPPKTLTYRMLDHSVAVLKVGWFTATMGLGFSKELDGAIANLKSAGCKRLIIDLRGNIGGGLGFARLASYMCPGKIPIGQSLTPKRLRAGNDGDVLPRVPMPSTAAELALALARFIVKDKSLILLTQGLGPQPFHGNIVVLTNEWTNSAAEMLANFAAENNLATIVGTRTSGTVLGARNFSVGSGYWLRLPIFGWFTSKGDTIEGSGVQPNIEVDPLPDLLTQGEDRQLSTAIALLASDRRGKAHSPTTVAEY